MVGVMKKTIKWFGFTLIILLILPYFIPKDFKNEIPEKPFDNSRFFTVNDISIHTQIYPNTSEYKGKVILIHGLGASTSSFRNNAPYLSENGFYVVSIDLPAFGYSSKERGIDHSQINRAQLIWQVLNQIDKEMNNDDPWHLVGHSMGGSTILAMAEQNPNQTKTLNLIAGAVLSDNNQNWLINTPLAEWLKIALRYYFINDKQIESLLESAASKEVSQEDIQRYIEPLKVKGTINALIDFVRTSDNFLISDFTQKQIPINLYWGKKDTWVSVDSIDEIMKVVNINSIELFDEGHLVHETSPEFNEILIKHLISP